MIAFILIVTVNLILLLVVNYYYTHVVVRNTQEYHIKQVEQGQWDALAFGSAYCRFGIDFSGTDMNGYNLGFASQFFYYTDKMLRQNARFTKRGGHIFLICAHLCFAEVGTGLYDADRYIKFLKKEYLGSEYSYWKYFKEVIFPIFFHPKRTVRDIWHSLNRRFVDMYSYNQNPHDELQVDKDAERRCADWCSQFGLKDTLTDEITDTLADKFKQTSKILEGMIDFCISQGLRPILVCTPISHHMNLRLSDRFLDKVLFSNIRNANKANIPFLDYTRDARVQDIKYYFNADMMNVIGRRKFTKILVEDVRKLRND